MHYLNASMTQLEMVRKIEYHAAAGQYQGGEHLIDAGYMEDCKWFVPPTGIVMTYTRDVGYSGNEGFWQESRLDACMHLSISFMSGENETRPKDIPETEKWVNNMFGRFKSNIWCQRPWSIEGKTCHVWHYHLFLKDDLKTPQPIFHPLRQVLQEAGFIHWRKIQREHHRILKGQE